MQGRDQDCLQKEGSGYKEGGLSLSLEEGGQGTLWREDRPVDKAPPPHKHQESTMESVMRKMPNLIWYQAAGPKDTSVFKPCLSSRFLLLSLWSPVASAWGAAPFSPRLPALCVLKPLLVFFLPPAQPTRRLPFLSFSGTKASVGRPLERKEREGRG